MKLYVILLAIAAIGISSCTKRINGSGSYVTEQRTVPTFQGIESVGDFKIFIVNSSTPGLSISAEDNVLPELKTEVVNGILKISFKRNLNIRHKEITITASTNSLKKLVLTGSGSLMPQGNWVVDDLECGLTGSGMISGLVDAGKITGQLSGSGNLSLSGKADYADLTVGGSGNIRMYSLNAREAKASVNGSGNIELSVSEKLEAFISGSGNVLYKGSPAEVLQQVNGSGKVIRQ